MFVTGAAIPIGSGLALIDIATAGLIELLIVGLPVALVLLCLGIPIVALILVASVELAAVERALAGYLLAVDVPTAEPARAVRERVWLVVDRGTWASVTYLASKSILGPLTVLVVLFGGTFAYALIATPLHYQDHLVGIHITEPIEIIPALSFSHDGWAVDRHRTAERRRRSVGGVLASTDGHWNRYQAKLRVDSDGQIRTESPSASEYSHDDRRDRRSVLSGPLAIQ